MNNHIGNYVKTPVTLVKIAEEYVISMFENHSRSNLIFHNLEHTEKVVMHAREIATYYDLDERNKTVLTIAAWFHDTGHIFTDPAHHEEKSVEILKEFMGKYPEHSELTPEIEKCIQATRLPWNPQTLPEQIMCDADTYHLGTDEFKETNAALKKEFELRNYTTLLIEWDRNTYDLLKSHTFFTPYCKERLNAGKEKNLRKIQKKLEKEKSVNYRKNKLIVSDLEKRSKDGRAQNTLISRGIQTMLRLTSQNHLDLSRMADSKANILISVNAIIISVILSVLFRKIETERYLIIPTIVFLSSALSTIVIAILSTRPTITKGSFTRQEILNKETNLLFFGNFHTASLEEYTWAMSTMMRDPDYLYSALVKDIYYLGTVLAKKYKLIRLAYTVFMIGMVLSVIAFLVAVFMYNGQQTVIINNNPAGGPL